MGSIDGLGEVISTDVLVLGGGIAGICAAVKARENSVDVLVVDKSGVGWAGQTPTGGGMIIHISPEKADEWVRWMVEDGAYLNNQEWTYTFASELHQSTTDLSNLGMPFIKKNGETAIIPYEPQHDLTLFDTSKYAPKMKRTLRSKGIRTINQVYVIDLLRRNGRVVGAIGFGLTDGKCYIFNAKSVIIAVGSCRYMYEKAFGVNTGEGPAMAYRAGAQLMNAEFGNSYTFGAKSIGRQFGGLTSFVYLENALGERIMEKHYPEAVLGKAPEEATRDFRQIADAIVREVQAGNGPIYLDMGKLTPGQRNGLKGGQLAVDRKVPLMAQAFRLLEEKAGVNMEKDKIEMELMFVGGQGPIRIDLQCRTTVAGLFAAGDAPSLGCGWTGAQASGGRHRGFGLAFAAVSGFRAGNSAGKFATEIEKLDISYEEAREFKERIFAPLGRSGDLTSADVMYQVHEAIVPVKYNFNREEGRLREAIAIIDQARQNLTRIGASDPHNLHRYHQAESMVLSADFTLRAALIREETRGLHYREDFPERDDKNWLKWIIISEKNGLPYFSTEPVPVEKYKVKL